MAGNGTTVIAVIAAADRPTASNVNTLYAIISALLPTAALVVGLRFYSRRSITKRSGLTTGSVSSPWWASPSSRPVEKAS